MRGSAAGDERAAASELADGAAVDTGRAVAGPRAARRVRAAGAARLARGVRPASADRAADRALYDAGWARGPWSRQLERHGADVADRRRGIRRDRDERDRDDGRQPDRDTRAAGGQPASLSRRRAGRSGRRGRNRRRGDRHRCPARGAQFAHEGLHGLLVQLLATNRVGQYPRLARGTGALAARLSANDGGARGARPQCGRCPGADRVRGHTWPSTQRALSPARPAYLAQARSRCGIPRASERPRVAPRCDADVAPSPPPCVELESRRPRRSQLRSQAKGAASPSERIVRVAVRVLSCMDTSGQRVTAALPGCGSGTCCDSATVETPVRPQQAERE